MSLIKSAPVFYLSLDEGAQRTQLCTRTLARAIAAGRLRAFRVGRLVRIAEPDLQAFIERKPVRSRS